ncbi:hypothetical protein [Rossellomorea vietnamensis]|uniref:hypothetical protein n=1 Tax=Rossellomorea vietnamensis TaxID=218284 RepID=UPI003D2DCA7E
MKWQVSLIAAISLLLIGLLIYIGPFRKPLFLQAIFLFFTTVMAHAAYKNRSSFAFSVLSICAMVSFGSIVIILVRGL